MINCFAKKIFSAKKIKPSLGEVEKNRNVYLK